MNFSNYYSYKKKYHQKHLVKKYIKQKKYNLQNICLLNFVLLFIKKQAYEDLHFSLKPNEVEIFI